jgi:hypothetical protein
VIVLGQHLFRNSSIAEVETSPLDILSIPCNKFGKSTDDGFEIECKKFLSNVWTISTEDRNKILFYCLLKLLKWLCKNSGSARYLMSLFFLHLLNLQHFFLLLKNHINIMFGIETNLVIKSLPALWLNQYLHALLCLFLLSNAWLDVLEFYSSCTQDQQMMLYK